MKRVLLFGLLAALLPSTTAHAQEATVVADCDQVTFTAPLDSRVIFSLDSSPPGEVTDGASVTQQFFPIGVNAALQTIVMDSHHWSLTVLEHGVQTAIQSGDVTGCGLSHLDVALSVLGDPPLGGVEPPTGDPNPVTVPIEPDSLGYVQPDLGVWADVALAPPW